MTSTTEGCNMDTDGEKSSSEKDIIEDMMDSEKFKHFFKNLIKEAVKEENKEYWERITTLEKQVFDLNEEKDVAKIITKLYLLMV